jgi:hypothetical protein
MKTRKNKNTRRKKYIKKTLYSRRKTRITRKKKGGDGWFFSNLRKKRNILKQLKTNIKNKIRDININYYHPILQLEREIKYDRVKENQDGLYFRADQTKKNINNLNSLLGNVEAMKYNITCQKEYENIIKNLHNNLDYELVTYDNILKLCESKNPEEEELYIYLQDVQNKKMKPINKSQLSVNDDDHDHDEPGSNYSGDSLPSSLPE